MLGLFDSSRSTNGDCRCQPGPDGTTIDASDCDGELATAPDCRATAIEALSGTSTDTFRVRFPGLAHVYEGTALEVLRASGRFASLVKDHDPQLAKTAREDPIEASRIAAGRPDPINRIATATGLLETTADIAEYETLFSPVIESTIAGARTITAVPPTAEETHRYEVGNTTVIILDRSDEEIPLYHVCPPIQEFDRPTLAVLETAYEWLADNGDGTDPGAGVDAVTAAITDETTPVSNRSELDCSIDTLATVLEKHTTGFGTVADLLRDPAVSDVYATGPASRNRLKLVRDGTTMETNVRLSSTGAEAIASRLRRESGRSFSRAAPTLDASTEIAGEPCRVAAVTDPATDGVGFAFRSGGTTAFTLPRLVANGTLPASAAGLLSVAVRQDAATLVAGARGAGKTTLLGALLWELSQSTRIITIEDTPELPIKELHEHGRDVQPLRTTVDDGPGISPTEALHTALRLGESALVLGEVRGEEAQVLYEAMRVGASGAAVLGTIHGDGGPAVKERVTADLGVPESSFATTDLLVTVESYRTDNGDRSRRVKRITEVVGSQSVRFEPLFVREDGQLVSTGRIERGNSWLIESITDNKMSYSEAALQVERRSQLLDTLAEQGETAPDLVTTAYGRQVSSR